QDSGKRIQAHMALMVTSISLGHPVATREHSEQGIALYDPKLHGGHAHLYGQDPKAACHSFGALALLVLGYPDLARERSREAIAVSQSLGHPTSRALALYFDAILSQYGHEAKEVQRCAEAITAISVEHGLSLWLANGKLMFGWALAEQGECS